MSLTANELVAQDRARIREIAPAAVQALPMAPVLIDLREPAEFETGHLPGAVNMPRGMLEFQLDAHLAVANVTDPALSHKHQTLVVYCRTGGRAALAELVLQQLGFTEVRAIAGGITAWTDAGLTVVSR